jgi:hypothetical protein
MQGLKPGDEVIAMDDLWGTYRLFTKIYKDSGTIPFCEHE